MKVNASNVEQIQLESKVPDRLKKDIIDRLRYCFSNVKQIIFSSDELLTVVFEGASSLSLSGAINNLVNKMTRTALDFREVVLYQNVSTYVPLDCRSKAVEKGWIRELAPGIYGYFGFLYNLKSYLDLYFEKIARECEASFIELPSVIQTDVLLKAGHFTLFPHHVYAVFNLDFQDRMLDEKNINPIFEKGKEWEHYLEAMSSHSNICLTPSLCYNYYALLKDTDIQHLSDAVVTVKSKCYRHEIMHVSPLSRQREFEMREIIFLGKSEDVKKKREEILKKTWDFAMEHDLVAKVVNAFDPFFVDHLSSRAAFQFNREMKLELRVRYRDYGDEEDMAVSSFNLHGTSFSKAFNILYQTVLASSGCVGFGLERWMLALLSRYGIEKRQWPTHYWHLF